MYPNSGRSIKSVVSILVKIGYIFSVLSAIGTLAACMSVGDEDYFILYVIGAMIVGGLGCLFTWIGGLWLYAYGEITDRLISIDERMERMERKANGVAPAAPAAPVRTAPVAPAAPTAPTAQNSCFCTACGARNSATARFCVTCSAELSHPAAPAAVPAAPKAGTGAWKCACGRVNASYVNACACGVNRQEIQM